MNQLQAKGVKARYHQVDITNVKAVEHWIETVEAELSTPTLIIPNAGIVLQKNFCTITPEDWVKQLNVNLNGSFYMSHFATKRLLATKQEGRVVFIGSCAADIPINP